jgi:hypothetical protein
MGVVPRAGSPKMKACVEHKMSLFLLGIWPRLAGVALIAAALWAGFFWATHTPGAL